MRTPTITKPGLFLFCLAVVPWFCSGQSMALEVLGSSGGTAASNSYSLTWTLGETNIHAATQGNHYLGAGFQQARKPNLTVGIFQPFVPLVEIKAYPNPAGDFVTVESTTPGLTLRLFDLLGRQVLSDSALNGIEQLQLSHLPAGTYLLEVFDELGRLAGVVKIQHYSR
jgi:hypothetical protein